MCYLCLILPKATTEDTNRLGYLAHLFLTLLGWHPPLPLYVELLDLLVQPDPTWPGLEHALLKRLTEEIQRSWGHVPVVVPESNLTAQLFLRDAGYRAVRVFHSYFGDEDGYLMIDGTNSGIRYCYWHGEGEREKPPVAALPRGRVGQ